MTDPEFMNHAEALLGRIEACCDTLNAQTDADIDNQRTGGMVTLAFPGGSQIVVNLQKPLHEVWLAARSGGYHYRLVEGLWQDSKAQGEFFAQLTKSATEQSGTALAFTASS